MYLVKLLKLSYDVVFLALVHCNCTIIHRRFILHPEGM